MPFVLPRMPGSDNHSTSSSRSGCTRAEYRLLVGILLKKPVELPVTFDNKILTHGAGKLAKIVEDLCNRPEMLQKVEVFLESPDGVLTSKKKSRDGTEGTHFDGAVVIHWDTVGGLRLLKQFGLLV